jgi:LPS sulfotransferase NodH
MVRSERVRDACARVLGALPGRVDNGVRPFLVFSSPRAGSELLVDLLQSRPDIRCDGELFKAPRRAPLAFLEGRARLAGRSGCAAWGSKLLFQQLRWFDAEFGSATGFLEALHERGFVLVVLHRRNALLQTLSFLHAGQSQFHFRDGTAPTFEPMFVDPAEVLANVFNFDLYNEWARLAVRDVPHVDLVYEDDLEQASSQQAAVDRIAAALGLPPMPVSTSFRSVAPRTIAERIVNVDDVVATFARTRFAHLVADQP